MEVESNIMAKIDTFPLQGPLLFTPNRFEDSRGWFVETWRKDIWHDAGVDIDFVQGNESFSKEKRTIRGLHFQTGSAAQAKLVRVLRGRILDIAVDIRPGSPDYGKHVAVELSSENAKQIFIPAGFAHGFCTLEVDTHVHYMVSSYYEPKLESGIYWNDPAIGIDWPLKDVDAIISEKDNNLPLLGSLSFES
jgi:dTDP-4-dehydrorhamnose 3,5-epimerase